jgi:hypothetical protein
VRNRGDMETIKIPGLKGEWVMINKRYNYEKDKCKCPNCGGLGIPWNGWFSCDQSSECGCVAVVSDGRAFIPLTSHSSQSEK